MNHIDPTLYQNRLSESDWPAEPTLIVGEIISLNNNRRKEGEIQERLSSQNQYSIEGEKR